jgi:hypothetical protein
MKIWHILTHFLSVVIQNPSVMLRGGVITTKQGTPNCHEIPKSSVKMCLDMLNVTLIQKISSESLH